MTTQTSTPAPMSVPEGPMKPFAPLVGDWTTETTHVALGDSQIHGRIQFEWLFGARFLIQRTEYDHPAIPDSISIIGLMEGNRDLSMQYFDSRGDHRTYGVTCDDQELRIWRDAPGFAQRSFARFSLDGSTLEGSWELNRNGQGFRHDMAILYSRA